MSRDLWSRGSSVRYRLVVERASADADPEKTSSSDEESVGSLTDAEHAAKHSGSVEALVKATAAGRCWPISQRAQMLEQAGLKGHLLPLLESFEMPLYGYSRLADSYLGLARERFLEIGSGGDDHNDMHGRGLVDAAAPSRFAWLLSNYLMVPGIAAEEWLVASETPMVVFESTADPVPFGFASFPDSMGAFYLNPRVTWKMGEMTYKVAGCWGTLSVASENLVLKGTMVFDISDSIVQTHCLIGVMPEDAKKFAFVYPAKGFTAGGFVYLDSESEPISVSQLSVNCTRRGFRFGGMQSMALDVANELEPFAIETTLPAIKGKGARRFCFVGPGMLRDRGFKDNLFGGFAYWFDDVQKHRFFPILGFSRVVERGPASAIGSAMLFSDRPSSEEVFNGILSKKNFGLKSAPSIHELRNQVVLKVSKLNQSGLTHPVVLRALVFTPNETSMESAQIQAVVSAAFAECSSHLIVEAIMNILLWLSVSIFTRRFRTEHRFVSNQDEWNMLEYGLFFCIVLPWSISLGKLLLGARGHRVTFGSFQQYWLRRGRLYVWWLQTVVQLMVIVQLWTGGLSVMSRSAASISLASCGALLWVQMLFLASPFVIIGTRFLPIVSAWSDMTSFLLVSGFLLLASAQASYALTELPLITIAIDTYLMGFIGEMKPQLFIAQDTDLDRSALNDFDSAEVSQTGFGYLILMVSSFILMVSMANIFIQVMGDAYSRNKETVHITLTRARAEESLITMLWMAGGVSLLTSYGTFSSVCLSLLPQRYRRHSHQARREFVWFTRGELREMQQPTMHELSAKIDNIEKLMTQMTQMIAAQK